MQLQLISFVLIILHGMDYTGCQQHSSPRNRQHKREYRSKRAPYARVRSIFFLMFYIILLHSLASFIQRYVKSQRSPVDVLRILPTKNGELNILFILNI